MRLISVRNVQAALPAGLDYLDKCGVKRESRYGDVIVSPCPVTTHYWNPRERVIFWAERDANPFFHLFESLWMLAGRNDVAYLTQFVKRMKEFSDDGVIFHGAYGHRWQNHFLMKDPEQPGMNDVPRPEMSIDQVATIIKMLKNNPDERRCVLQMWDAEVDLGRDGKDLPCNTQAYFLVNDGKLDMTVCNRSNDMIWGAYGANAVHFSFLQEYMAAGIGVPVGGYWQMSNNFHVYDTEDLAKVRPLIDQAPDPFRSQVNDPYQAHKIEPFPLVSTPLGEWQQDLGMFLDEGVVIGLRDPFFRKVATPMYMAHRALKEGDAPARFELALEIIQNCRSEDWRMASEQWILRRWSNWEAKQ